MKTIEEISYFKYVAWVTVISFALFTGYLSMRLATVSETLASNPTAEI